MQVFIHYFLHFGFPFVIAFLFFRNEWLSVAFILLLTLLVDLDHLLATPVFQANRCGLGLHYLHTYIAIVLYVVMLFLRRPFNIIGMGLMLHMFTDLIDCIFMFHGCNECFSNDPALKVLKTVSLLWGI